jgi:anhydro-N-acetylmuramic acid kinase
MNGGKILVLGLMSGTSLDGLDMALCEFKKKDAGWDYGIIRAETRAYPQLWRDRLTKMHYLDAPEFWKSHVDFGHFIGKLAKDFIRKSGIKPDLISSHGHTIFHQPDAGYTMQAGDGAAIAAESMLPVVSDFRSADVAMKGQGAPLVPLGDKLLFSAFDACLNIGGFCNISMDKNGKRTAFDICPANIVLNRLATLMGHDYDNEGQIARDGKLIRPLLDKINSLFYYSQPPPKSLGREWLENEFQPLLQDGDHLVKDLLNTCVEHIGFQVGASLENMPVGRVLVTGGGAHNSFLMETIGKCCQHELIVPDKMIVDYKEALVFAFLGALRWTGEVNILSSVTGCRNDHSGGSVFHLYPY